MERNLIASSTIFKSELELLRNVVNEWKQYIWYAVIVSGNFTKKDGDNRESNWQTIPLSWDFLISFSNISGLLFKMILLAIELIPVSPTFHFVIFSKLTIICSQLLIFSLSCFEVSAKNALLWKNIEGNTFNKCCK